MIVYIENKIFNGELKKGYIQLKGLELCNTLEIDILKRWISQAKFGAPVKSYKRDIRFVGRFKEGVLIGAFPYSVGFDEVYIAFDECEIKEE